MSGKRTLFPPRFRVLAVVSVGDEDSKIAAMVKAGAGRMRRAPLLLLVLGVALVLAPAAGASHAGAAAQLARIDHVADGDTVDLTNGAKVRLVQIDTPEVYFRAKCYGKQASAITKRLLPPGTLVRLTREPKTDSVDSYGRLLRYVVRGHLNVNVYLVRVGAAAPYFYDYRRGRYASLLVRLARHAHTHHLGLWGRCLNQYGRRASA